MPMIVVFESYMKELYDREQLRPEANRIDVPSNFTELAAAISMPGDEVSGQQVRRALSNEKPNLRIIDRIITYYRNLGFDTDVQHFFKYLPPDERDYNTQQ